MIPLSSHSSSGPERHSALGELADVERWARRTRAAGCQRSFVSEEVLDGTVFSVHTSTSNGMHHVLDISSGTAVDSRQPVVAPPTEAERAMLRSVVRAVLDLVGRDSGTARADVTLTAQGPRIATFQLGDAPPGAAE